MTAAMIRPQGARASDNLDLARLNLSSLEWLKEKHAVYTRLNN